MSLAQWVILALIATPLLILARDAWNRRQVRGQLWLAFGVLAAILLNIALSLQLGR